MKGLFVINLKTYKQGDSLVRLVKIIETADKKIILGVPATEIYRLAKNTKLKIYAQHVDYFEPGRNTGYILPEAIKEAGAVGVFLNHSEHPLDYETIKKTVLRCRKLRLSVMLFAKDVIEAKKLESLNPDYIIIEPPELVAGNVSVSEAKPELIERIKKELKGRFLVGAGIHSKRDFEVALRLGACGIALSSAITTSNNPSKKLKELIE